MRIEYTIDQATLEETRLMLANDIEAYPISYSQIMYANVVLDGGFKAGARISMGRIPLVMFLADLRFFIVSNEGKTFASTKMSDENQTYTVRMIKDEKRLTISRGKEELVMRLPTAEEISHIAKEYIHYYMDLIPGLKHFTQMKYIKKEFEF